MDTLLYWLALGLVKSLQALPLRWVARIGRGGGALAYIIDARHRRVAQRNLAMCLGQEKSPQEIQAIARENFRRLGENYCCAVKTAAMGWDELKPSVEFLGVAPARHAGAHARQHGRGNRSFRKLRAVRPFRAVHAIHPVCDHLSRPAPVLTQPIDAVDARKVRLQVLRAAH